MRRSDLLLLASLQLCRARQPGFSIHDDLLAHPQFEVVFSDSYISEPDAIALLESKRTKPDATYVADVSQTDLARNVRESAAADGGADGLSGGVDEDSRVSETYEIISSPPSRYLCSVPAVAPPPAFNKTATDLAKAEEAREISRASAKGWELMSDLNGHCLYFMSGWWSYSFCYGKDIVQFHAVPSGTNGGAPVKEPGSQEYVLGTVSPPQPVHGGRQRGNDAEEKEDVAPPNTELQIKGDQRYLVQRLDGGTLCDLTKRPRTIEIQYHCQPGATIDRIGWIKEVTTCSYLMVVHTPRLCADVAFQPPKETRAHPISCRPIVRTDEEVEALRGRNRIDGKNPAGAAASNQAKGAKQAGRQNSHAGMTIGGVVIGGRQVLGTGPDGEPGVELAPPKGFVAAVKVAGSVLTEKLMSGAKKAGHVEAVLTREELEQLGLDKETIEGLAKEFRRIGGDDGWEIAVEVVQPGETAETGGGQTTGGAKGQQGQAQNQAQNQASHRTGGGNGRGTGPQKNNDDDEEEGSQESFFKEEL